MMTDTAKDPVAAPGYDLAGVPLTSANEPSKDGHGPT
jgi:hypothetical protein